MFHYNIIYWEFRNIKKNWQYKGRMDQDRKKQRGKEL